MKDVFEVQCSALPDNTRVVGFRGSEGISRPYSFDIFLLIPEPDFDLDDAMGARGTLIMSRDDSRAPIHFQGIFAELLLIHELGGRALVQATLVPRLWQLGLSFHSRVFTGQSITDVIKVVLDDGGFTSDDFALDIAQTYKPEEHICQYQESDLDFLSRWMEREGLYYYFEHTDEHEKLIISDSKSFQKELGAGPIRFHSLAGGDTSAGEHLNTFTCQHRSLPARVRLKDYDHAKPSLDVTGSARVSKTGVGEVNVYGARFFTPDDGKRLAKLRSEELLAREKIFRGTGSAPYLRSGYLFELTEHSRSSFDTKYLAVEVTHHGNQAASTPEMKRLTGLETDDVYRVEVTAIPEKVQFRAEPRTAWPRIYGYENATIDGPADSQYAQIDDHGRYAVKFMFDESDLKDGKASTWVRMLQPHGGAIEGWHFPLRKGTEVLLSFLGGDPDRPVITGVVPTAATPSPVTRTNHTTNVIQTGGRNRLELEDQDGSQRITLSTPTQSTFLRMGAPNDPNNLILSTNGVGYLYVGANFTQWTVGDKKETADATVTEEFKGPFKTTVTNLVDEHYLADQKTVVGAVRLENYQVQDTTVNAGRSEQISGGLNQTIKGGIVRNVTGSIGDTISGGLVWSSGPTNHTIKGSMDLEASGPITVNAPKITFESPHIILNTPDHDLIAPEETGIHAMADFAFAKKVDVAAIVTESYALHLEINGADIANFGFQSQKLGIEMNTTGLVIAQKAVNLEQGAIMMFTKALVGIL